jgi:hypothetical protein
MCKCGVKSNYGLDPSGLGIGHYCHMVDYDEVGYFCRKWNRISFCFAISFDQFVRFNRALGNASGNLMRVEINSSMSCSRGD